MRLVLSEPDTGVWLQLEGETSEEWGRLEALAALGPLGMPIRDDGVNEGENLTLACRNALLDMLDLLQERGVVTSHAYAVGGFAVPTPCSAGSDAGGVG